MLKTFDVSEYKMPKILPYLCARAADFATADRWLTKPYIDVYMSEVQGNVGTPGIYSAIIPQLGITYHTTEDKAEEDARLHISSSGVDPDDYSISVCYGT